MRVCSVADTVELQVRIAEASFSSGLRKFLRLGELNAVGCSLNRCVTNLTSVCNSVEKVRAQRWLTAGELYGHLAFRLDRNRVVQHGLDLVPRKFVYEANLVRVHKAGVAHHVAAVRQIDRQNRTTSVRNSRSAMIVKLLVIVGADIAARKDLFKILEEGGVNRHDVFEMSMDRAILHHQDFAVTLDDL